MEGECACGLPPEVWLSILCHLPTHTIVSFHYVNQFFHHLVSDNFGRLTALTSTALVDKNADGFKMITILKRENTFDIRFARRWECFMWNTREVHSMQGRLRCVDYERAAWDFYAHLYAHEWRKTVVVENERHPVDKLASHLTRLHRSTRLLKIICLKFNEGDVNQLCESVGVSLPIVFGYDNGDEKCEYMEDDDVMSMGRGGEYGLDYEDGTYY